MMYDDEKTCANSPRNVAPLPEESLTDMLRETRAMALDVQSMSRKIKGHLFGSQPEHCTGEEKKAEPCCFREELGEMRNKLINTCHDLAEICARIGV